MAEQIIPATDLRPAPKAARVNEFIDVILTEWATPGGVRSFPLEGLAEIDNRVNNFSARILSMQLPNSNSHNWRPLTMPHSPAALLTASSWKPRRGARPADERRILGRVSNALPFTVTYTSEVGSFAGTQTANYSGRAAWLHGYKAPDSGKPDFSERKCRHTDMTRSSSVLELPEAGPAKELTEKGLNTLILEAGPGPITTGKRLRGTRSGL